MSPQKGKNKKQKSFTVSYSRLQAKFQKRKTSS
jgi:hypothetical protein